VTFTVTATDDIDPRPVVDCSPASGSLFPIGTTQVSCTATDAADNEATAEFDVIVLGADQQADLLLDEVASSGLPNGVANRLSAMLAQAEAAIAAGNDEAAWRYLNAFIHSVEAQAGKKITLEQASELTDAALQIQAVLGFP